MTPEELAAEFDQKSQNCAVLRDGFSHASFQARLDGKREAYAHCAVLIRLHPCPPPLRSEVENLRAELKAAHIIHTDAMRLIVMQGQELTAANAEIARLKSPDFVTVRREDLRNTLSLTYPYIDEDTFGEIDARITAMEVMAA